MSSYTDTYFPELVAQKDFFSKIALFSESERLIKESLTYTSGFAGHRARVPPDPIPNSEVKPCSVPRCSVVFGHVNLGKLAAHLYHNKCLAIFG